MKKVRTVTLVLAVSIVTAIFLWRQSPPLAVTATSLGMACPSCPEEMQGPWVRVEVQNTGRFAAVIRSVTVDGPDASAVSTVGGVTSPPERSAVSPDERQTIDRLVTLVIPTTNTQRNAVHIAWPALQTGRVPDVTEVRIHYTYLNLPFTLRHPIRR